MKSKVFNSVYLEGYVYEHELESKVTGEKSKNPGTKFIKGTLSIATDEELLNIVKVTFVYVTPITSKGKANTTYNILYSIIDGTIGNVMEHGKENAGMVRIDTAIGLNEWYKDDDLISVKINQGGFVHQIHQFVKPVDERATFDADMLINNVRRVEANEERNLPEKVIVKGCVFNYNKEILPVEFSVYEPYAPAAALDYFENLGAASSSPVFTHVRGVQISKTIMRRIEEEDAWGGVKVREVPNTQRDFVINWAQPEPYDADNAEAGISLSELSEKIANREIHLAEIKARRAEWEASQKGASAFASAPAASSGAKYDF